MRIVVKIGTSTLAHPGGRLNIRNVEELVKVLADLKGMFDRTEYADGEYLYWRL